MKVKPLRPDLEKYLRKRGLGDKYHKQIGLLENDWKQPSLKTERLVPKNLRLYSFRIDRKYRAIFVVVKPDIIEVIQITDHYQ